MKKILPYLLILSSFSAQAFHKPFRVVIDPGHGGIDHGAVTGRGVQAVTEKDLTLLLAREVARKLRLKGYAVRLTRDSDIDVPLPERTAMANHWGSDAFLSIHMNSTQTRIGMGQGIETYILNHTSEASSVRLEQLENKVLGQARADADPSNDIALILKDLRLDANQSESKRLACLVQRNLVSAIHPSNIPTMANTGNDRLTLTSAHPDLARPEHGDRGVKQALFYVLLGADMPSILVEAGFLSSAQDRERVLNSASRDRLSNAITQSMEQFRRRASLSTCKVR